MQETLITFETAKLAKEKGFNIPVIPYYTPNGYCTESEGYQTERLEESNWNDGKGSYPTLAKNVLCSAPIQSLLQKWLREVHNINISIHPNSMQKWYVVMQYINPFEVLIIPSEGYIQYDSYEEALEVGLQEALKLI